MAGGKSRFDWLRLVRFGLLAAFAAGIGLLVHRLERSPEQRDLTRYVETTLPPLRAREQPILVEVARLGQSPGLAPAEARQLLVAQTIPAILQLRKQAEQVTTATAEARALAAEYVQALDKLLEACRASVRVIDNPKLSTQAGLAEVRRAFIDAEQARDLWDGDVRQACRRHHLTGPAAR